MTRLFFILWMATFLVSVIIILGFTPVAQPAPYAVNTAMIPQAKSLISQPVNEHPVQKIQQKHLDYAGTMSLTSTYPAYYIE